MRSRQKTQVLFSLTLRDALFHHVILIYASRFDENLSFVSWETRSYNMNQLYVQKYESKNSQKSHICNLSITLNSEKKPRMFLGTGIYHALTNIWFIKKKLIVHDLDLFFFSCFKFKYRYWIMPVGRSLGIKSTKTKPPVPNKTLETTYSKISKLNHKTVSWIFSFLFFFTSCVLPFFVSHSCHRNINMSNEYF